MASKKSNKKSDGSTKGRKSKQRAGREQSSSSNGIASIALKVVLGIFIACIAYAITTRSGTHNNASTFKQITNDANLKYNEANKYPKPSLERIQHLQEAIDTLASVDTNNLKNFQREKLSDMQSDFLNQLCLSHLDRNELHSCIPVLENSIRISPYKSHGYQVLGGVLRIMGRTDEAAAALLKGEKAVTERFGPKYPSLAGILQGLYFAYSDSNDYDMAERYIKRTIELNPSAQWYDNWAGLGGDSGPMDNRKKVELCNRGLELDPSHMGLFCRRAHLYTLIGEWDDIERDHDQLIQYQSSVLHDDGGGTLTKRQCLQPYHATYMNISATMLRDIATSYAAREAVVAEGDRLPKLGPSDVSPLFDDLGNRLRKLRVGYVSGDLRNHPVGRNVLGMFMAHSRQKYDIYAFATAHFPNDLVYGETVKHLTYVDISGISDHAELAKKIRGYQMDVLVDLTGWTLHRRLQMFDARPAPVQISHGLGFVGSSGARNAFDYFISDTIASPARFDSYYVENLIRLPQAYLPASHMTVHLTPQAAEFDPAKADKGLLRKENGLPDDLQTTFVYCSFQSLHKISREAFDTWMRILLQTPDSVLWMVSIKGDAREKLAHRAAKEGIAKDRILFSDGTNVGLHLVRAQACDLYLDSWPYNAHSTAMDVIFSGVPPLVYLSDYHDTTQEQLQVPKMASRVSASILHTLGMPQLIAPSISAFEGMAVKLATDSQAYSVVREELLQKRIESPLFDVISYTRAHEEAYDTAFRLFLEGKTFAPFDVASHGHTANTNENGPIVQQVRDEF